VKPAHKTALRILLVLALIAVLVFIFTPAQATNTHDITINNYIDHPTETDTDGCLCVTGGISDSDLAKGMAMAMSGGGHELDYSTTDNQLSVSYARQLDEDEEGAYSIKYGRRWDKLGKALFHVTAVPEQGNDLGNWVMVGATIRW